MGQGHAGASTTGPLGRVLVRPPDPEALSAWSRYGWRSAPDPGAIAAEHEALRSALAEGGAEVVVGTAPVRGDPDAVYAFDPVLISDDGAILLRPGKPGRRDEPEALGRDLEAAGVPVVARMEAPALAEGGDLLWLDERTLLAGRGYRTNDEGIDVLRKLLPAAEVVSLDLPHFRGPREVLHLRSFISLLDRDLAVAYLPLMPVRLVEMLRARGIELVEVPEEEFGSQGANVLALGPRRGLALEGSPQTRRRMEAAGVEVRTYVGDHLSVKGDGGPTCLTLPLARR